MSNFNEAFSELNTIPIKTWRWLKVNNTSLEKNIDEISEYNLNPLSENYEDVLIEDVDKEKSLFFINDLSVDINATDKLKSYVHNNHNSGYFIKIEPEKKIAKPIIFDFTLDNDNPMLLDNTFIIAGENSEATIIFKYKSDDNLQAFNATFTKVHLQKNAKLNLIKIQMLGKSSTNVDYISVNCEENSNLQSTLIDLGSNKTIGNCNISLIGEKSNADLNTIYFGKDENYLDYNYKINFQAKKTTGNILTNGLLMDKAHKIYKGTIDLLSGSTGSIGNEEEFTILLSPNVKNISVPLLLSGEHDVQGNHATSTGRLNTNALFYFMSRGIDERLAKKMIVEASFNPIIEKIPDDNIKQRVREYIRGNLDNA